MEEKGKGEEREVGRKRGREGGREGERESERERRRVVGMERRCSFSP